MERAFVRARMRYEGGREAYDSHDIGTETVGRLIRHLCEGVEVCERGREVVLAQGTTRSSGDDPR